MNEKDSSLEKWQKVRFGEIARNVTEAEREPAKKGLERVIGLEHIDPGSLRIRRWDSIEEGTSFTRVFRKGQVLFGKRRAYQRKAALAEFDGICSSDIYVFEANKDKLIPELLPFIVQDDRFFDFAIGTSSGSLSPRTKWKFLETYEIYLPPLKEQKRIAEILWATEDVIVKNETFLAEAEHYKQLMMRDLFSKGIGHTEFKEDKKVGMVPVGWDIIELSKKCDIILSNVDKKTEKDEIEVKLCNYLDIFNNDYITSNIEFMIATAKKTEIERFSLNIFDVVITKDSETKEDIASSAVVTDELKNVICGYHLAIIRPKNQEIDGIYLSKCIGNPITKSQFIKYTNGVTRFGLGKEAINKTLIPLPPLPEQKQIAAILTQIDETIAAARETIESTKALKMKLINELLCPMGNEEVS